MAERERMSREIHDTLAQGFLSIMAQARAATAEARRAWADTPAREEAAPVMERLRQIEITARDNLGEARSLVAVSAPHGLDKDGLAATVTRLCERFSAESGVQAEACFTNPDGDLEGLAPVIQVVVVRAVQEALANVRKHAVATSVDVDIRLVEPGRLQLTVQDDGVGMASTMASAGTAAPTYGLSGLEARVELVGGTVEVKSTPGEGTTVRIVLPASKEESQ